MATKSPHPGYLLVDLATFEDVQLDEAHAKLLLAALQSAQVTKALTVRKPSPHSVSPQPKYGSKPLQPWRNRLGLWG